MIYATCLFPDDKNSTHMVMFRNNCDGSELSFAIFNPRLAPNQIVRVQKWYIIDDADNRLSFLSKFSGFYVIDEHTVKLLTGDDIDTFCEL